MGLPFLYVRSPSAMLTLRVLLLVAVVWGTTICGAPTNEEKSMRSLSRVKRGPGGLVTILEFTKTMRSFCETINGVTKMLELYPLSAIGDVLFNLPIPIPNVRFFDRLNLLGGVQRALLGVQNLVNRFNFLNLNFGKRDVSSVDEHLLRINEALRSIELSGSAELREGEEEYFDPPTNNDAPNATPAPDPGPNFLMTMRDVFGLQDVICPAVDFVESVFTKSPLAFLHLERLPIPIPDGENSFNLIKAFDVYNITGAMGNLFG